jgi:transposase
MEAIMEVIHPRCAGLDVHKQTVVACARIAGSGPLVQEVRTFATTTSDLLEMADWLESLGVEHVAMEATGVYWKPVWHVLEDANLKITSVLSDILGKSGRAVLHALIDGQSDPQRLASHVVGNRLKASHAELAQALSGRIRAHHRFMLRLHLGHIDALDKAIADIEREVGLGLEPFRQAARLLSSMPGLSQISANVVVAEIGIDMSRFATPGHLLSWACLCPRNDESAGKRRSTRLRRGGIWLKTTLVQAAWAAVKVKGSYLQAQFHRIRARRGAKKAIIAVAASMLTAAWHMLRDGTEWRDLGAAHFDRADATKTANRLIRRLQQIGYAVHPVHA